MANPYIWLFFGFSGRVSRAAYIPAGLLLYVARFYPVYRIMAADGVESVESFWAGMFLLVIAGTLISHLALAVKRLHDMGRPGWFAAVFLVGDFLVYLFLCIAPGQAGPNRYGARPDTPA